MALPVRFGKLEPEHFKKLWTRDLYDADNSRHYERELKEFADSAMRCLWNKEVIENIRAAPLDPKCDMELFMYIHLDPSGKSRLFEILQNSTVTEMFLFRDRPSGFDDYCLVMKGTMAHPFTAGYALYTNVTCLTLRDLWVPEVQRPHKVVFSKNIPLVDDHCLQSLPPEEEE